MRAHASTERLVAAALLVAFLAEPAAAQAPVDRLTADPTGDFIASCEGDAETGEGPPEMDLVGATALVDPYGGLWFVVQADGDPESYFATNPQQASFTWYLHDLTIDRRIRVIDEARGARRRLVAEVDGEEMPWPVDRVYQDGQVTVIVSGSAIDDGDEIVWGAVSRQSDSTGTRCDEVGGGRDPSIPVAMGGPEASSGGQAPPPSADPSGTTATTAETDAGDSDDDGFPAAAVAGAAGVLVALGAVLLLRRKRSGSRGASSAT